VSWLSGLRTLQVFERYLKSRNASKSDRKKVKARIRTRLSKLARKGTARKIERSICRHALCHSPISTEWVEVRLEELRRIHVDALQEFVREATAKPKRKTLHALRLRLKTIRYQEEWALEQPSAESNLVEGLKQAQTLLGDYEERAEFRQLARQLKLKAAKQIDKDWRQARQGAREVPHQLTWVIQELGGQRLRLVEP
jgi:CHAD domain-containing protein